LRQAYQTVAVIGTARRDFRPARGEPNVAAGAGGGGGQTGLNLI